MTRYIFLGPTLSIEEARALCPAIYLPPVRLGDVWRVAAFGGASEIGIVDGYFERVPAVWHKEILWALANGIVVAGAASMGALRAAELASFGMKGIGRIYTAFVEGCFPPYASEPFEDDDEVAVVHGPAESGYLSSEAMVNIRATLAAAAQAGVISPPARDALVLSAKQTFYKDRSWAGLLRGAASLIDANECDALRAWLPHGRIDQKRCDAIELLRWFVETEAHAPEAQFCFADTALWRRVTIPPVDPRGVRVLLELRLQAHRWQATRAAALTAIVGGDQDQEFAPLLAPDSDPQIAATLLEDYALRLSRRQDLVDAATPILDATMIEHLRATGAFAELLARADAKDAYLRTLNVSVDEPQSDIEISFADLCSWFADHVGGKTPASEADLASWLDFDELTALWRALAAEYVFVTARSSLLDP
ncbi:MAG: hypothetical protein IPK66_02320 [Rhodospirillales bacterium]|nr:hypothetical protein [Rhodospirillales bacterium]